jgi:hypothetical protein
MPKHIQQPHILELRCMYLIKLHAFQFADMYIFYPDLMLTDSNMTFKKYWQMHEEKGTLPNVKEENRLM